MKMKQLASQIQSVIQTLEEENGDLICLQKAIDQLKELHNIIGFNDVIRHVVPDNLQDEIIVMRRKHFTMQEIASKYGISISTVWRITNGVYRAKNRAN